MLDKELKDKSLTLVLAILALFINALLLWIATGLLSNKLPFTISYMESVAIVLILDVLRNKLRK